MERQNTSSLDWAEQLLRHTRNLGERPDRQVFIEELTRGALEMAGAPRAYGMLMDGDTLAAETTHGDSARADAANELRKRGARLTLATVRAMHDPRREAVIPTPELSGKSVAIPFVVKDHLAGAVILESEQGFHGGARELGSAIVFVALAARLFAKSGTVERGGSPDPKNARPVAKHDGPFLDGVGAVKYLKTVVELERDAIELALRQTNWNKEEAARRLGISRASIYMKVKKFGLQKPPVQQV